jgi:hypothetical protein
MKKIIHKTDLPKQEPVKVPKMPPVHIPKPGQREEKNHEPFPQSRPIIIPPTPFPKK